ncbi:MAG TPA: STAS domain-containing protein [Thermoleophilaceae bacterium]|nr:STAS domain-containing protein [Thermoleophilaceae bacterium]
MASFVVATEQLDSGVPVVSITGELDLATAAALEDPLLAACDHTDGAVAVDLTGCGFIDLRGLHVLLNAQERLERAHRALVLITGNPAVLRILQVTRVDGLFEIHPSRAAITRTPLGA